MSTVIVGIVRCLRSLHRPRHRPNGTGLSSAIMAAPLVAAPPPASVPPDGALVDKNELRWVVDILQAGAVDGALVLVGLDGQDGQHLERVSQPALVPRADQHAVQRAG